MISVIIPLYNKEKSIAATIESVTSQNYRDLEIIVVNDGSKDGSEDIVKLIPDKRIVVINQENQGVAAARNTGI